MGISYGSEELKDILTILAILLASIVIAGAILLATKDHNDIQPAMAPGETIEPASPPGEETCQTN